MSTSDKGKGFQVPRLPMVPVRVRAAAREPGHIGAVVESVTGAASSVVDFVMGERLDAADETVDEETVDKETSGIKLGPDQVRLLFVMEDGRLMDPKVFVARPKSRMPRVRKKTNIRISDGQTSDYMFVAARDATDEGPVKNLSAYHSVDVTDSASDLESVDGETLVLSEEGADKDKAKVASEDDASKVKAKDDASKFKTKEDASKEDSSTVKTKQDAGPSKPPDIDTASKDPVVKFVEDEKERERIANVRFPEDQDYAERERLVESGPIRRTRRRSRSRERPSHRRSRSPEGPSRWRSRSRERLSHSRSRSPERPFTRRFRGATLHPNHPSFRRQRSRSRSSSPESSTGTSLSPEHRAFTTMRGGKVNRSRSGSMSVTSSCDGDYQSGRGRRGGSPMPRDRDDSEQLLDCGCLREAPHTCSGRKAVTKAVSKRTPVKTRRPVDSTSPRSPSPRDPSRSRSPQDRVTPGPSSSESKASGGKTSALKAKKAVGKVNQRTSGKVGGKVGKASRKAPGAKSASASAQETVAMVKTRAALSRRKSTTAPGKASAKASTGNAGAKTNNRRRRSRSPVGKVISEDSDLSEKEETPKARKGGKRASQSGTAGKRKGHGGKKSPKK